MPFTPAFPCQIHRPHPLSASRRLPLLPAAIAEMQTLQDLITTIRARARRARRSEKQSAPIPFTGTRRRSTRWQFNQDILGPPRPCGRHEVSPFPSTGNNARSTSSFDVAADLRTPDRQFPPKRERLTKELSKHEKSSPPTKPASATKIHRKAPAHIVEGLRKQTAETPHPYDKARAPSTRWMMPCVTRCNR